MTVQYRIAYTDESVATRNIYVLPGDDGVRIDWRTELERNVTSTGIYETVVQNTLRFVSFDCYFTESVFHQIETWMMFAMQGQTFSFYRNPDKGGLFTITSTVPVGSSTLPVNADPTSVFDAEDPIIVRKENGTKWNVLVVDTTTASPDTIEVVDGTSASFTTGDLVEYYYSFNELLLLDERFDPDRSGNYWHHTFNCVEVRSGS